MRTVSALDVRKRFGQILDEAATGERIVIERAGEPIAALVPLGDLAVLDPALQKQRRLEALHDLGRLLERSPRARTIAGSEILRSTRRARAAQVARAVAPGRSRRSTAG